MKGIVVVSLVLVAGCSPRGETPPAGEAEAVGRPVVYTVNYPLAYFAERIGGGHVDVVFPAPPEGDPAFWKPDVEAIAAYQQADLILLNGAGYAKWTAAAFLPAARLVDTSAGFEEDWVRAEDSVAHTHGPGGEHAHGEVAFTTWLDPKLAIRQARTVAETMAAAWPERREAFLRNADALEDDLSELDVKLAALTSALPGTPLVFSHPVYQYLVRRYGLNGRSVHWEPDAAPDPKQWKELDDLRARHPAAWMIWEGEPRPETVAKLRERGLESVVFDPCGNRPASGDYLTVMRANVERLRPVFE